MSNHTKKLKNIAKFGQSTCNYNRGNIISEYYTMTPLRSFEKRRSGNKRSASSSLKDGGKQSSLKRGRRLYSDDEQTQDIDIDEKESKRAGDNNNSNNNRVSKPSLPLTQQHAKQVLQEYKGLDKYQTSALLNILTGYDVKRDDKVVDEKKSNIIADEILNVENSLRTWITGPCKCGKTFIVKVLASILKKLGINFLLLSGTIDGALDLNCLTVEKWCGFDSMRREDQVLDAALLDLDKWITPDLIIIDNAAFVDKECFKIFSRVMGQVRKQPLEPFGKVPLVVVSDAAQEPLFTLANYDEMFFEWPTWQECRFNVLVMKQNYYHDSDNFARIKRLLLGQVDARDLDYYKSLKSSKPKACFIPEIEKLSQYYEEIKFVCNFVPTRLHCIGQVADVNNNKLAKLLQSRERMYYDFVANFIVKNEQYLHKEAKEKSKIFKEIAKDSHIPRILSLCTGLQVVLLEDVYALTTTTMSGLTLTSDDNKREDDSNTFKSSGNNDIKRIQLKKGSIGIVTGWSEEVTTVLTTQTLRLPKVLFKEYQEFGSLVIEPYEWSNLDASTSYYQLPLMLGWDASLFKRPQLSLESAHLAKPPIDARQFYNCISKVRKSLTLGRFDKDLLKLDEKIVKFYRKHFEEEFITVIPATQQPVNDLTTT